jgi:HlyD family secretion protein
MKKVTISIVTILVFGLSIGACGWIKARREKSPEPEQKVEVVKHGDFQMRISATGNLEPLVDVEIKSNVEGEIITLYVDEGDYVEAGQVLLEIDPEQYVEQKIQAKADVDASQAQFRQAELNIILKKESLDSQRRQAEDNVKIAEANSNTTITTSLTQIIQAETQIQTSKNDLVQDEIALDQAKIALNQAELTLSELETARDSAKIELNNAEAELKRNKELFEKKLVSKRSLEEAQSRRASASSQYNSAVQRVASQKEALESQQKTIQTRKTAIDTRNATLTYQKLNLDKLREMRKAEEEEATLHLKIAETRLNEIRRTYKEEQDVVEESKESAKANLLRRKSSLKNQEERLTWTTIKAPMSGTVTLLEVEEGEIVTSGRSAFAQSPPLMTIGDLSKMVVKTFINEVDMERLRLNQEAEIKADAYQNKIYKGRIVEIAPSGVERDNIITFEVMVKVVGSPPELRPGMSADVDIITYEEKDVLLLPRDAIEEKTSAIVTAKIGDDGTAFKPNQPIEVKSPNGKTFKGNVIGINDGELTIGIDSSQRGLRPGRHTFVVLVNGREKLDGVAAQVDIAKERFALLDEDGAVSRKDAPQGRKIPIETGMQNDTEIIIKSGLKVGDRVILPHLEPKGLTQWGREG